MADGAKTARKALLLIDELHSSVKENQSVREHAQECQRTWEKFPCVRDQASGKTGVEAGIYSRMKSEANRMDELKPVNVDLLRSDIAALRNEIRDLRELLATRSTAVESGYLDAKAAAAYCGLSRGTFDEYHYQTRVKVHGFKLDGKVLYRREDLDEFIKLYEIRSKGT